jgi:hypothetical protein
LGIGSATRRAQRTGLPDVREPTRRSGFVCSGAADRTTARRGRLPSRRGQSSRRQRVARTAAASCEDCGRGGGDGVRGGKDGGRSGGDSVHDGEDVSDGGDGAPGDEWW